MTPDLSIVLICLSPWSTASEASKMILIASSQITKHNRFLLWYLFIQNKIILANKLILLSQSWCCLYSTERSEKIAIWFMQNLAEKDWVVLTQFCAYFCIHIAICLHVMTGDAGASWAPTRSLSSTKLTQSSRYFFNNRCIEWQLSGESVMIHYRDSFRTNTSSVPSFRYSGDIQSTRNFSLSSEF